MSITFSIFLGNPNISFGDGLEFFIKNEKKMENVVEKVEWGLKLGQGWLRS